METTVVTVFARVTGLSDGATQHKEHKKRTEKLHGNK